MKPNQKLLINFDNIKTKQILKDIDKKLYSLVGALETDGNMYGPVTKTIDGICVTMEYADKLSGPVKQTIFGYDSDVLLGKQYK